MCELLSVESKLGGVFLVRDNGFSPALQPCVSSMKKVDMLFVTIDLGHMNQPCVVQMPHHGHLSSLPLLICAIQLRT
jgi:hypothetical protein